ncbi:acyl-CoA N-acyltransferase [Sphaerulina musiva SO2202]|uniref:Acyl-CoA N-acyltransferase n=1 Tax=Sphaerulina musiva (strain SO2202) TaxID=692275 RepID=M3BWQ4_SPHMS|nr:acyl-CoA N-acyltransferase [Sphaerulina musiva SO2202]EMF12466.1 acyl-CoA N-acyltransferase [Sphaerulina musiva SO2202]
MSNSTEAAKETNKPSQKNDDDIRYICYGEEKESPWLPAIKQLISKDLSEPYSIYVYRYFLYQWGKLCFMAINSKDELVGVIVCKLEPHRGGPMRGYIAMLATREDQRGKGIASKLVRMACDEMIAEDADEIALETEDDNIPSLRIYEKLGFIRSKRLHRYYLNGNTAYRLLLYLKSGIPNRPTFPPEYPPLGPGEAGYPVPDDPRAALMNEDLIERQVAQLRIADVYDERHDVRGGGT